MPPPPNPPSAMNQICIRIPSLRPDAPPIELDVTIGGAKRLMHYRVETVDFATAVPGAERVERLRAFVDGYDRGWELVQIGTPSAKGFVPVMFRQAQPAPLA